MGAVTIYLLRHTYSRSNAGTSYSVDTTTQAMHHLFTGNMSEQFFVEIN